MIHLTSVLGKATSEKCQKQPSPPPYSIFVDMRRRINNNEPFTLVLIELARHNGQVIGDTKYICDLVGGQVLSRRSVGVLVQLGQYQRVYDALEKLAQAPFSSDLRIGLGSFPGNSNTEVHAVGNVLKDAQNYIVHRRYDGQKPKQAVSGENVLEWA